MEQDFRYTVHGCSAGNSGEAFQLYTACTKMRDSEGKGSSVYVMNSDRRIVAFWCFDKSKVVATVSAHDGERNAIDSVISN